MSSLQDRMAALNAQGAVDVSRLFPRLAADVARGGADTHPADRTERKVSLG